MPRRSPRSGYAWRPRPTDTEVEKAVTRAAADLFDVWATGAMPTNSTVAVGLGGGTSVTTMEPVVAAALEDEAGRMGLPKKDQPALVEDAAQFVTWARATTKVRAARVLARFAVRAAFERTHQYLLTAVIADDNYPRRWSSSGPHVRSRRLTPSSSVGSVRVAFYSKMLSSLTAATASFEVGRAAPVNIQEPYLGLRTTHGWALDPIRPPMSAVRYGASLVQRYKGHAKLQVLAVEPGLTAALQGLAWFLPGSQVHRYSPVQGDTATSVTKADAVVVNLASGRSLALVEAALAAAALTPPRTLARDEVDHFWRLPVCDAGNHVTGLVDAALRHLADDGLLVVLGDVESGVHHQATAMIAEDKDLQQIALTPLRRPVQFGYSKPPWAPFGGLPATGRFVSAWMRVMP